MTTMTKMTMFRINGIDFFLRGSWYEKIFRSCFMMDCKNTSSCDDGNVLLEYTSILSIDEMLDPSGGLIERHMILYDCELCKGDRDEEIFIPKPIVAVHRNSKDQFYETEFYREGLYKFHPLRINGSWVKEKYRSLEDETEIEYDFLEILEIEPSFNFNLSEKDLAKISKIL